MAHTPVEGSGTFRHSIAAIEAEHPLIAPRHADVSIVAPRLDRLDAKTAYYADYIEHLEQRVAALERRLSEG